MPALLLLVWLCATAGRLHAACPHVLLLLLLLLSLAVAAAGVAGHKEALRCCMLLVLLVLPLRVAARAAAVPTPGALPAWTCLGLHAVLLVLVLVLLVLPIVAEVLLESPGRHVGVLGARGWPSCSRWCGWWRRPWLHLGRRDHATATAAAAHGWCRCPAV
jgi:hypothetical protein